MIGQKGFHPSAGRISAPFAGMVAIALAHVAYAASLEAPQVLALITKTADSICSVVSTKGEAESSEIKGQVKAQLSGLAAKLADVGVSGTGSINNDQYQNVLRQNLAATIHDNQECKLKVFDTLQTKLLNPETMQTPSLERTNPAPTTAPIPAPQPPEPIAWRDDLSFWTGEALLGVVIRGRITSPAPAQLTDAYIISEITGEKKALQVEIAPGPRLAFISDINQIPPTAILQLWATFAPPGISAADFVARWGSFRFHAEYAGMKYDKVFSREAVETFVKTQFPEVGPHVTPKAQNK